MMMMTSVFCVFYLYVYSIILPHFNECNGRSAVSLDRASEVTTVWRYRNSIIIIIIYAHVLHVSVELKVNIK